MAHERIFTVIHSHEYGRTTYSFRKESDAIAKRTALIAESIGELDLSEEDRNAIDDAEELAERGEYIDIDDSTLE